MIDQTRGYITDSAGELVSAARYFFKMEASGGILLVFASLLALIIANTPLYALYHYFFDQVYFTAGFSDLGGKDLALEKPILLWINDGFMAVFFFLIGLEIKREFVEGELSSRERALLPAMAAIGGMVVPALIYYFINKDSPETLSGWAVPAATDIAFALAILSLLGSRVPTSLKVLLTAIAVIDDLGAILIIAAFYSHDVHLIPLYLAAAMLFVLIMLNYKKVSRLAPYILTGIILWVAVLESGIHATLAGVITALFIPVKCHRNPSYSPCKKLEHDLHPWVAFAILPIFGFANAGVPFDGMGIESLFEPVTLGIIAGLFIGKQIGVFVLLWLTIVLGLSQKPDNISWLQLYAVSILCGIGFTMSLFIGGLAFEQGELQASLRLGVLIGSILSAFCAYLLLIFSSKKQDTTVSKSVSN
jgi:NhaA family Na+:H+ antiporter